MVLPGASDGLVDGTESVAVQTPVEASASVVKGKARDVTVMDEANARLKMPAPRAKDAPEFKGTNVVDFLDDVERCADSAGLSYNALPSIALRYCTRKVRNVVERAAVWGEDDWSRVRTYLIDRYGSNDDREETSPEILQKWVQRHADHGSFKTKKDVDKYLRKFEELANPLIADQEITQNEVNRYFFKGLPDPFWTHVFDKIPDGSGSRVPHVDQQMTWIRQFFDKRALYDDVKVVDLGFEDSSSDSDSDDDYRRFRLKKKKDTKKKAFFEFENRDLKTGLKGKPDPLKPFDFDSELGGLTRKLEELKLSSASVRQGSNSSVQEELRRLSRRIEELQTQMAGTGRSQGQIPQSNFPNVSQNRDRCGLCGRIANQPDSHPLGYNYCPEAKKLLEEGLVKRDGSRLLMPDGTVLPAPTSEMGGVAQKLREMKRRMDDKGKSNSEFRRDAPPHLALSSMTGLQFDRQDVLYDGVIGVALEEYTTNWGSLVSPATRTEKKEVRFDPKHREEKGGKDKDKSSTTIRIPPAARSKVGSSKDTSSFPVPVPSKSDPAPPVQNTREGVKRKAKEKEPQIVEVEMDSEEEVSSPTKKTYTKTQPKAKSGPTFHYTSNIKDSVKSEQVYGDLKDTKVTISIGDLLGLAPDLQKRFVEDLKVHREYVEKPVKVSYVEEVGVNEFEEIEEVFTGEYSDDNEADDVPVTKVILNFDPDKIAVETVVEKYVNAVRCHTVPVPLYAMITGKFQGLFGGVPVTFMVDTGSELNLVPAGVHAMTRLTIDLDGTRWTLKGVNGRPTPLAGCIRDAPVMLGNYSFAHHFFVNPGPLGGEGDEIILGQPWLQWYAACIQYRRSGTMTMKLWQGGDPDEGEATVSMSLTDPKSARNKSNLPPAHVCPKHKERQIPAGVSEEN